jgi:hypothetical protein
MLVLLNQHRAWAATATFEAFPDSTILTSQIPGLTFSNTIILSSGITLNEFEFPPRSGTNVASDNGGPITITFSPAVTSFSGYFTYALPLTLSAFNSSNAQVGTVSSHFSNNEALSGAVGSSPNELLQVSSTGGIVRITITGDPAGSSFTMDDISYTSPPTSIPLLAPPILMLLALLLGMIGAALASKNHGAIARLIVVGSCLLPATVGILSITAQEHATGPKRVQFQRFTVSHSRIPANTPITLTVSAQALESALIPASGNLIRLAPGGATQIIQRLSEVIRDRGIHTYNGRVTVSGRFGEGIRFLVSAAGRGSVRRALSNPITINVVAPHD